MLAALSPARRRLVLVVAALVAAALVAGVVTAVLSRSAPAPPTDQAVPGPVLLVPGYGGSTSGLEVLATTLTEAGRDATVVRLAGDGTGDLAEQAAVLDVAVREALARTGAASVDLVGYSAGGVTVRLWLRDFDGGRITRRVVTLGSPHHGTDLAALAGDVAGASCPEACHQLATDSDLLRSLNAGDETPAGPLWAALWTTGDRTVVPPDSGALEGALDFSVQSVCPDLVVSHGDLPRDPVVIAMAVGELGSSAPRVPSSEVCASR